MKPKIAVIFVGLLSSPAKSSSSPRSAFTRTGASIMPNADEKGAAQTAKVWDRFANGYSKQPIKDEEAYQKKLAATQSYFKPTDSVLEIGCGTGGTSIIHSPFVGKILATDISSRMIEIASKAATDVGVKNVEFKQASIDSLKLPDQSQDVVLGMSIIHLLDSKEEAMRKVHAWLRPGGYFITSTIYIGDMGLSTNFFVKRILPMGTFFGFLPSVYSFTKIQLKDSLKKTGFDIEYVWQPTKSAAAFIVCRKK